MERKTSAALSMMLVLKIKLLHHGDHLSCNTPFKFLFGSIFKSVYRKLIKGIIKDYSNGTAIILLEIRTSLFD